jgi:hypothetical protein
MRNKPLFELCDGALICTLAYLRELISKGEVISKRIEVESVIEQGKFRGLTRQHTVVPYAVMLCF